MFGWPRTAKGTGSVKAARKNVRDAIFCWRLDNRSDRWSHGLPMVQLMLNSRPHSGITETPISLAFAAHARSEFRPKLPQFQVESVERRFPVDVEQQQPQRLAVRATKATR